MLFILLAKVAETVAETVEETDVAETVMDVVTAPQTVSVWSHIWQADPIVKLTLLLLLGFSVMCWAIIFFKWNQIKKAQKTTLSFWGKFSESPGLREIGFKRSDQEGPLFAVFTVAQEGLAKLKKTGAKMTDYYRNFLTQQISQAKEIEMGKLEQYVSFLATTASVAPFIGLFGTVWGILTAFLAIGKVGSTSLATVGPYIAEALVATAFGLFAAIPAVIAYNYFVGRIGGIQKMMNLFADDYILKSEKELA